MHCKSCKADNPAQLRHNCGVTPDDFQCQTQASPEVIDRLKTYAALLGYMEGSSAVIGTLTLPILGTAPGADAAATREAARQLGYGFQLTNFIRDVAEDLRRGRVYLPLEDLAR